MLKAITLNLEAIEALHFFWIAASEKEQISEQFFHDIGEMKAMTNMFDENFTAESVRRALSAIKNREPFSGNKMERKFWNLNMWAMEDLELTAQMISPLKRLNIDNLLESVSKYENSNNYELVEVYFAPIHEEEFIIKENKLIINFFRIRTSFENDDIFIGDLEISDYIKEKLKEVLK